MTDEPSDQETPPAAPLRRIDHHDVRAFCARAAEAVESAREAAETAMAPGWIVERRERLERAAQRLARARRALDELEACLTFTLDEDEAAQKEEAEALLGEPPDL